MTDPLTRHILVGLDLGPRRRTVAPGSRLAAEVGRWLAGLTGARVTLLHSSAADESWEPEADTYVSVPDGIDPAGRAALAATEGSLRADGIDVRLLCVEEPAWLALIREVLRTDADLVVTGKRSADAATRRRIGSVSMKLLRKCPAPVWVVKPGSEPVPRRILAATDLTPVGGTVLRYAAALARACKAELHVVHAVQLTTSVELEGPEAEEEYAAARRADVERALDAACEGPALDPAPRLHVGITSPTHGILECAKRYAPDLVVMGTVSRAGIAGFLVGNTAERLLDALDCALLAVKPPGFVTPVAPGTSPGD